MFDGTSRGEVDADPALWWCAALATAAVLLIPLFTTSIPPLLDYPNHLARMLVIALRHDPVMSAMYRVDPRIVPNVAMDLLVPPLALIMPLDVAGRVFIAICLVLPLVGAAVLHRALFARRSYWPLGIALVSYNGLLFMGFVNFLAGLGLALVAAGVWARQRDRPGAWRVATACVLALVLFFCHLMTLAFYGAVIAAFELDAIARDPASRSAAAVTRRMVALAVPFIVPAALFWFGAPLAENLVTYPDGGFVRAWWAATELEGIHLKLLGLTLPFRAYPLRLENLRDCLDLVATVLPLAILARALIARRLRIARGAMLVAALAWLAYPLVPSGFGTAAFIDWRLPLFATFLCFCALDPRPPRDGPTWALAAAVAVIFLARVANIAIVWDGHNRDLADLARVIAPVAPGALVLAVTTMPLPVPGGDPRSRLVLDELDATTHLPALVLLERHAFWPNLFSSRTLQPVHVQPRYRALSVEQGVLPTVAELDAPTQADLEDRPYLKNWRNDFDYVLVMRPGALASRPDPEWLEPLGRADIAALYRIRR